MSTTTAVPRLSDAQLRVLGTMIHNGGCVGARTTDPRSGYVNTTTARSLVSLGYAREREGQRGVPVFVITDLGTAHYWGDAA